MSIKVEESDRHVGEYGVVSDIDDNDGGTYSSSLNALDRDN